MGYFDGILSKKSGSSSTGEMPDDASPFKVTINLDSKSIESTNSLFEHFKKNADKDQVVKLLSEEMSLKRLQLDNDKKRYEIELEKAKVATAQAQHEATIEMLKEEAKTHKVKAEYEDYLARERNKDRLKAEAEGSKDMLAVQEKSARMQEELRRETVDYEFKKRTEYDGLYAAEFWKKKSEYKKATRDITLEKYRMKMSNELEKVGLTLSSVGGMVSNTFHFFYDNQSKFIVFTSGMCLLVGSLALSRQGVILGLRQLQAYLAKPKLVMETNLRRLSTVSAKTDSQIPLIYNKPTQDILTEINTCTQAAKSNEGILRNYLFYGPPGTGKTLFAKNLAKNCGLSYGIVSCGDILPLKEHGAEEIGRLFSWAKKRKGFVLFMDEADAFLKKRDQVVISEGMRSSLNSFLYHSSDRIENFMFILATNRPDQLDRAVTDRVDMMVEFSLPDAGTRGRLFQHYVSEYFARGAKLQDFSLESVLAELVKLSEGFSGREISKLCMTMKARASVMEGSCIDRATLLELSRQFAIQHKTKVDWSHLPAVREGSNRSQLGL